MESSVLESKPASRGWRKPGPDERLRLLSELEMLPAGMTVGIAYPAAMFNRCPQTIAALVKSGKLRAVTLNGRIYSFNVGELRKAASGA